MLNLNNLQLKILFDRIKISVVMQQRQTVMKTKRSYDHIDCFSIEIVNPDGRIDQNHQSLRILARSLIHLNLPR